MENNTCLNCGHALQGHFCSQCGQSAHTHRITFRHFIFHTVLHGTFHFEKGMLFTARQALTRPGQAALDYIKGKRVNYYNVFYFVLILIGMNLLLSHLFETLALRFNASAITKADMNEVGKKVYHIFSDYGKLFVFALVPITSLNSYLIFKRKKLNLTEHFVISGMWLLGVCLLITLYFVLKFSELWITSETFADSLLIAFMVLVPLFIVFSYYNAFKKDYKSGGFFLRMLLFFFLIILEFYTFIVILLGLLTNWQGGDVIIVL